jgi:DNA-binding transcriptional MerR regulator
MEKSPDAFRTISEVAELLETPAHVLRFWESRFPQIRPVKRAGGRRYYRPADVALLTGIKRLLHDDGMTIRGVQKILREQGVKHVSGVAEDAGADDDAALEAALAALGKESAHVVPQPQAEVESAQIIALETALKPAAPPEDKPLEEAAEDAPPHEEAAPASASVAPEIEEATAAEASEDVRPVAHSPAPSAPVDLFGYVPPRDETPAPAFPPEPVLEAPMTLWAEEDDHESPQKAQVTAFPAIATESADGADTPPALTAPAETSPVAETQFADDAAPVPPAPADPPPLPASENKIPNATLAARLRALDRSSLGGQERETFGHLRIAARDLRQRLQAPVRPGS